MDVKVSEGTQELYNYIKINAPSLSYVQKVNRYTNVHSGLGIFSARSYGGCMNMSVSQDTKDSIADGQYTTLLNFVPSLIGR